MIARGGQCFLHLCNNVQQTTIQPWITQVIQQGSTVNTDEYSIYARLPAWGYVHVTVNHSEGEYARDADGDGVNEVHVNTMEGVWSLLRSWLRPHRGISQHFLPLYIGFFQTMPNIRQRGQRPSVLMRAVLDKKSLLSPLLALLLTSAP